jgi:NADH:ubiquinone oxidoreductase subunit H
MGAAIIVIIIIIAIIIIEIPFNGWKSDALFHLLGGIFELGHVERG